MKLESLKSKITHHPLCPDLERKCRDAFLLAKSVMRGNAFEENEAQKIVSLLREGKRSMLIAITSIHDLLTFSADLNLHKSINLYKEHLNVVNDALSKFEFVKSEPANVNFLSNSSNVIKDACSVAREIIEKKSLHKDDREKVINLLTSAFDQLQFELAKRIEFVGSSEMERLEERFSNQLKRARMLRNMMLIQSALSAVL